jgi:hypothetical protein
MELRLNLDIVALLIMDCLILGFTKMFALMGIYIICWVIWKKKPGDKGAADRMDVVGFLMLAGLLMLIGS